MQAMSAIKRGQYEHSIAYLDLNGRLASNAFDGAMFGRCGADGAGMGVSALCSECDHNSTFDGKGRRRDSGS